MNAVGLRDELVAWLQSKVAAAGAAGTVVGLSGGIDSAVVGALCKLAFPDHSLGVIMPCESDPLDAEYAAQAAEAVDLRTVTVELTDVWRLLLERLEGTLQIDGSAASKVVRANVKPRLRMTTLYYIAAHLGYLVVGTENLAEMTVGYSTKYGDAAADLMPLAGLLKREVYALGEVLSLPRAILDRPPTAGLWAGQTDEGEMGITYEALDHYLLTGEGPPEIVAKIQRLHRASAHKRSLPPVGPVPQWRRLAGTDET